MRPTGSRRVANGVSIGTPSTGSKLISKSSGQGDVPSQSGSGSQPAPNSHQGVPPPRPRRQSESGSNKVVQNLSELMNVFIECAKSNADNQKAIQDTLNRQLEAQGHHSRAVEVGIATVCAVQKRTNELLEDLVKFGRGSSHFNSDAPEGLKSKKDAISSKGYVRFRVASSFNGFGCPEHAYPGPTALSELVGDSIRKVLQTSCKDQVSDAAVTVFGRYEHDRHSCWNKSCCATGRVASSSDRYTRQKN